MHTMDQVCFNCNKVAHIINPKMKQTLNTKMKQTLNRPCCVFVLAEPTTSTFGSGTARPETREGETALETATVWGGSFG